MKIILRAVSGLAALSVVAAGVLFLYPRPADTTEARVFAADGSTLDYCKLPTLDGRGLNADDIPKAYTPHCSWTRWPMPILANCTEPLAPGVVDLRGLWRGVTDAGTTHIERIEQCGNRTVVTSAGIIHDFITDGTLTNGARDVHPNCMNVWAAIEWQDGVMNFRPFGLPMVLVSRDLQGEQLVWTYPSLGEVRMQRICRIPTN